MDTEFKESIRRWLNEKYGDGYGTDEMVNYLYDILIESLDDFF